MARLYRFLLISILTTFCLCSMGLSASAQPIPIPTLADLPVETLALENPSDIASTLVFSEKTNKKTITSLTDTETESRYEIYAYRLDNISYAPLLFDKFKHGLEDTNKFESSPSEELEFTLRDGSIRTVTQHIYYSFADKDDSKTIITVEEIAFTSGSMAIVIIGYYSKEEKETGHKLMMDILATMLDKPADH